MSGPYATTAHAYRRAGWAPLPLPARAKSPVPEGWTGRTAAWPSGADVEEWCARFGEGNVGLRMPPNVLGVDVDAYRGKGGGETLTTLEADLGALPDTWRSTSRDDGTSGIRFYTVPAARRWPGVLGAGIEVVRHEHRYAVAWPSVHPEGMTYRWLTPGGAISLTVPLVDDLVALPQAWLDRFGSEALTEMPSAGLAERDAMVWLGAHGGGNPCEIVRRAVDTSTRDLSTGSRHEAALLGANRLVWLASEGHPGSASGLYSLRLAFLAAVQGDRPADVAMGEWGRLLTGAVNLAAASHPSVGGDPCRFQDLVLSAPLAGMTEPEPVSGSSEPAWQPPVTISSALPVRMPQQSLQESPRAAESSQAALAPLAIPEPATDPLEAAWRASLVGRFPRVDWHALWADESQEEWLHQPLVGRGRSVVIYSPPKVGKSLLALELAVALTTATSWLGHTPTHPLRVLLLDFENSPRDDLRVRLRAMGWEPDDLDNLVLLSFPVMSGLDTVRGAQELLAIVEIYGPDLVVVDTVSRVIQGEENSNDTWLQVYRLVGLPLKTLGIAVLRLDHTGKDEARGMRGGSAKYGDVDAVWRLTETVPGHWFRLECTQSRMAMPTKVLEVERRTEPALGHYLRKALDESPLEGRIRTLVRLADEAGLPNDASRGDLARLAAEHGLGKRNETLSEVGRRRKARPEAVSNGLRQGGHAETGSEGETPSETGATPEGHTPRSEAVSIPMRQDETAGARSPVSTLRNSGALRIETPGTTAEVEPEPDGWWATIAGTRRWIDRATGETHDAPPG